MICELPERPVEDGGDRGGKRPGSRLKCQVHRTLWTVAPRPRQTRRGLMPLPARTICFRSEGTDAVWRVCQGLVSPIAGSVLLFRRELSIGIDPATGGRHRQCACGDPVMRVSCYVPGCVFGGLVRICLKARGPGARRSRPCSCAAHRVRETCMYRLCSPSAVRFHRGRAIRHGDSWSDSNIPPVRAEGQTGICGRGLKLFFLYLG